MAKFRILALDGGGIRGVLTAVLLDRLQQQYPRLLNEQPEATTLFAGTSTGGILSLGLADGLSPQQIRDLYVVNGRSIFDSSWLRDITDLGGLAGAKYNNVNLKRVLQKTFNGKRLGDLDRRVLIASFQLDNEANDPAERSWKPKFFHNFPGPDSDAAALVVDVAMETSAAPTYFPSYNGYVDGGVIANNPSMAALAQVLDSRNEPADRATLDDVTLLSVGTGMSLQYIQGRDLDWGDAQWIKPLINLMMDGSVGVADFQCKQLLGASYERLEPVFPVGTTIGPDEVDRVVDLLNLAQSVDLTHTLAWLRQRNW
jgi:uncharacterized protein